MFHKVSISITAHHPLMMHDAPSANLNVILYKSRLLPPTEARDQPVDFKHHEGDRFVSGLCTDIRSVWFVTDLHAPSTGSLRGQSNDTNTTKSYMIVVCPQNVE